MYLLCIKFTIFLTQDFKKAAGLSGPVLSNTPIPQIAVIPPEETTTTASVAKATMVVTSSNLEKVGAFLKLYLPASMCRGHVVYYISHNRGTNHVENLVLFCKKSL